MNTWKGTARQQGGKECGTEGQCTQLKMSDTQSQSKDAFGGLIFLYLLETALISSWSWVLGEWPAMLTGSYKYNSWIQLMNSPLEVLLSMKEKNDILPKHARNNYKENEKNVLWQHFEVCTIIIKLCQKKMYPVIFTSWIWGSDFI